jgi:hypothetical protein
MLIHLIQITSLILFVGILKFIKLLRFNNRFAVLILTLKTAWDDLLGFFAVFFLVFFAFVQVKYKQSFTTVSGLRLKEGGFFEVEKINYVVKSNLR